MRQTITNKLSNGTKLTASYEISDEALADNPSLKHSIDRQMAELMAKEMVREIDAKMVNAIVDVTTGPADYIIDKNCNPRGTLGGKSGDCGKRRCRMEISREALDAFDRGGKFSAEADIMLRDIPAEMCILRYNGKCIKACVCTDAVDRVWDACRKLTAMAIADRTL